MTTWKRPEHLPLPTVYRRYQGPKPMPDGRKPNFWIQEATVDLDDAIVEFMSDSFLKDEIFCSTAGVLEDPESLAEIQGMWRIILQQRMVLVALTDWPDGAQSPRIAGCNATYVQTPTDQAPEVRGKALRVVLHALHHVEERVDAFAHFGAPLLLNALGLSVGRAFRGQDLGLELLRARVPLARAVGVPLTITVFTGVAAQKQSERAGFHVLAEQRYDAYKDADGKLVFPDAPCDVFQFKAMVID